jgi:hypothetical protein
MPTSDDYYTPPELFNTLGLIFDVDVCAPQGGIPWIPAQTHYSLKDDGLTQPWHGRVWCNPPYSKPGPWMDRFTEHHNGVALVQVSKGGWCLNLWNSADGLVLLDPKFKFIHNDKRAGIYMPVMLVAYGDDNVNAIARLGRLRT